MQVERAQAHFPHIKYPQNQYPHNQYAQVQYPQVQYPQPREGGIFGGRGQGVGFGCGIGQVICYNYGHPQHFSKDCTNPNMTCSYYKDFDHIVKECPLLIMR